MDQLLQFAAFYSDKVYIHNFLSNHEHQPHSDYIPSLEKRRYTMLDDIYVLFRLRPLIEAGLIVPVTSTDEVCPQCIALDAFGAEAGKRFLRERKQLAKRFLDEMTIFLSYRDGEWLFDCEAPEKLLEHGARPVVGSGKGARIDKDSGGFRPGGSKAYVTRGRYQEGRSLFPLACSPDGPPTPSNAAGSIITRYNKITVTVITDSGQQWNLAAGLQGGGRFNMPVQEISSALNHYSARVVSSIL